jgi:formate/nitrite transporter FocA (FNT family)
VTGTNDILSRGHGRGRDDEDGGHASAPAPATADEETEEELDEAFERLLEEGQERLERPMRSLVPTGLLGGIDVGVGVLAYLVVRHETQNPLLASLAFSVGFVALLLARSELFTENFLVPVTAVAAGHCSWGRLARLWAVTLVTNIVGGALMIWVIITARPDLRATARTVGEHYAHLGIGLDSFLLAVLAGVVITLMTRMQHATDSLGVRLVPAVLLGALLVGAELFHCVLDSVFILGAAFAGGDVTIGGFLTAVLWAGLGNVVGGIGLVTALRLVRTAPKVEAERHRQ